MQERLAADIWPEDSAGERVKLAAGTTVRGVTLAGESEESDGWIIRFEASEDRGQSWKPYTLIHFDNYLPLEQSEALAVDGPTGQTEVVEVRLTPDEHHMVRQQAEREGLSVADYVRARVLS